MLIPAEKNPLTPRETAARMLEHMHDDVSYDDIVRQLRILQDIDNALNDVDLAGFAADDAVDEARIELNSPQDDDPDAYHPASPSIVLRSRSLREWQSLADRPERAGDSILRSATWHR